MKNLAFGDLCRARCSAPARYLGEGLCLFVSAQDNDLCVDHVSDKPYVGELPLPTDRELCAAAEMRRFIQSEERLDRRLARTIEAARGAEPVYLGSFARYADDSGEDT